MAGRIQDVHQAATALESYFLRRVLSEVHTSEDGLTGGGFAGGMFKEMFDEAVADAMSAAGGVGIGEAITKQLATAGPAAPAPKPAAAQGAPETHTVNPTAVRRAYTAADPPPSSLPIAGRPTDRR